MWPGCKRRRQLLVKVQRRFGRQLIPGKISGACGYKAGQPMTITATASPDVHYNSTFLAKVGASPPVGGLMTITAFAGGNPHQTALAFVVIRVIRVEISVFNHRHRPPCLPRPDTVPANLWRHPTKCD